MQVQDFGFLFKSGALDFKAFNPGDGLVGYTMKIAPDTVPLQPEENFGMQEVVKDFLIRQVECFAAPIVVVDTIQCNRTGEFYCNVIQFRYPVTGQMIYLFLVRPEPVQGMMEQNRWRIAGYAPAWPQDPSGVVWLDVSERSREALLIPPEVDPSVIAARLRENGVPEGMVNAVFTPNLDGRALKDAHEYLMRTKGFDERTAWAALFPR